MTIEQTIKKAIEGGFPKTFEDASGWPGNTNGLIRIKDCVLDPLFWQALGKARGQEKIMLCPVCGRGTGIYGDECFIEEWKYQMHRFISHLAEGKTIESYFETL